MRMRDARGRDPARLGTTAVGKHALLIGVRDYEDRDLHSLPAVAADLHCLSQVLEEPAIGGFEVETVPDPNAGAMKTAIGDKGFPSQCSRSMFIG